MKVILVGDLHINNNKQYTSNSDSYHEVFHVFDMIKERVRNDNAELLIFLGDIFDSPSNITTSSLTIVSKLFGELSKLIPIITIVGNHDDVDCKTSDIQIGEVKYSIRTTVLSFLENNPNIKVVNKPEVIRMTENVEIAFIPYSNNIEADNEFIEIYAQNIDLKVRPLDILEGLLKEHNKPMIKEDLIQAAASLGVKEKTAINIIRNVSNNEDKIIILGDTVCDREVFFNTYIDAKIAHEFLIAAVAVCDKNMICATDIKWIKTNVESASVLITTSCESFGEKVADPEALNEWS